MRFVRHAVTGSLVASGLAQLLLVISGVLVARWLGPEDRGYLALIVLVAGIIFLVTGFGMPSAVTYFVARDAKHTGTIARHLLRLSVRQVTVGLLLQGALLIVLLSHTPTEVEEAGVISLLLLPAYLAFSYGLAVLQGQGRFRSFNVVRIIPTVIYVGGVAIFVLAGSTDLLSVTVAWVSANVVGAVLVMGVAVRGPRSTPDAQASRVEGQRSPTLGEMMRYGLRSMVSSASPLDQFRLDQAIVGLFLTPVALGLYVVAQAFTILPRLAAQSVGLIAFPRVASESERTVARRMMWRYFWIGTAIAALVAGAVLYLAGDMVNLFFGEGFSEAEPIVQVLIVGSLLMAARRILADGMNGLGHPGLGTLAEISSWVVLVPVLALFLPRYGAVGVALALTVSWGASLALLVAFALLVGSPAARVTREARRMVAPRRLLAALAMAGRGVRLSLRPPQARSQDRLTSAVLAVCAVLAALAAGIAVARVPLWVSLLVALLIGALLFGFIARRAIRARVLPARSSLSSNGHGSGETRSTGDPFRLARILYYIGMLFLSLVTLRAVPKLTVSDAAFLASFLVACMVLVVVRRPAPLRLPVLLLFGVGLFALGGLASSYNSYDSLRSVAVVVRLVYLTVFWFWLGTVVLEERRHVYRAASLWVAGAAACGAAAVIQIFLPTAIPTAPPFDGFRATGFTWQPNDLGGITCVALVPAMMLASHASSSGVWRVLSHCLLLSIGAGLLVSGSVGSYLAAAAAIVVWVALQRPTRHTLVTFAVLCVAVSGAITVQALHGATTPMERLSQVTRPREQGGTGSVGARIDIYQTVERSIRRDPFVGVGLDLESATKTFPIFSYEFDVHNIVIATWYKAGLFGMAGVLVAFLAIFRTGWATILRSRSSDESMFSIALVAAMVAFFVLALSSPILFVRYGWASGALLLALRAAQHGRQGARQELLPAGVPRPAHL